MKAEAYSALCRLQDDPPVDPHTVSRWLDAHERDVLAVLGELGPDLMGDLLGIMGITIERWRERRRRRKEEMKALMRSLT